MLISTAECYNPMLTDSFFYYFYIHSSDKYITAINTNIVMIKGVAHKVTTTDPPHLLHCWVGKTDHWSPFNCFS